MKRFSLEKLVGITNDHHSIVMLTSVIGMSILTAFLLINVINPIHPQKVLGATSEKDYSIPEFTQTGTGSTSEVTFTSTEPVIVENLPNELSLMQPSEKDGLFEYVMKSSDKLKNAKGYTLIATDLQGNKSNLIVVFGIENINYPTSTDLECKIANINNVLNQLIDQLNCLAPDAESELEMTTIKFDYGNFEVNKAIYSDLRKLLIASGSANIDLKVNSAYRSYDDQTETRDYFEKMYGEEKAKTLAALPGRSEHQLGTAIDFTSSEVDTKRRIFFQDTKAFEWMKENAWKYGFVMSFPDNHEEITGFKYEPWHWRYVGKEYAKNFHDLNTELSLAEYLYVLSL